MPGNESPHPNGIELEAWRHYADVGRQDKATMLKVEIWLIGISTGIIYFIFKDAVNGYKMSQPLAALLMSLMGVGVSVAAAFIALLYGGYSKRNWDHADDLARYNHWYRLIPAGIHESAWPTPRAERGLLGRAMRWSSHKPEKLAPVFPFFFWISMLSGIIHW